MTLILMVLVPVVVIGFFAWALCRVGSIPTPPIPDNIDQCWTCGLEIPPGPDFCSDPCAETWDVQIKRIRERRTITPTVILLILLGLSAVPSRAQELPNAPQPQYTQTVVHNSP